MIRFEHVSKFFAGRVPAISDVTVEITDGEFVFLIGPSGAGKTTFLRLLTRDLLPSEGTIMVDDWNVVSLPVNQVHLLRRKIGTVFQDFKLLSDRTVLENVGIVLEILSKREEDIKQGVDDVLSLVGLSGKENLFPRELSAGEMQRTAIARAVVGGPKVLLADEPTGNLDPTTSWEILDLMDEINKLGTTVIMASHNVEIVNRLKRRTIALEEGKVVSDEKKGHYRVSAKKTEARHIK